MPQNDPTRTGHEREWLVRTRNGSILGPYDQNGLIQSHRRGAFGLEDEIAPSLGAWVSAQVLSFREEDEHTKTSTRTHQTSSTTLDEIQLDVTAPSLPRPPTPTTRTSSQNKNPTLFRGSKKTSLPLVGVLSLALIFAVLKLRQTGEKPEESKTVLGSLLRTDSPFLQDVYDLIETGRRQEALRQLSAYQEKHPNGPGLEHLIPYAALLITDEDAPQRARNYLEKVLSSNVPIPLKGQAHEWLGYLQLSSNEGDMGESHFLETLRIHEKNGAARFNLGRAYLKQEKYTEALRYLQLAELEVPDLWLVHIYKGRARFGLKQFKEARQSFQKAVELSADRWVCYIYYSLFLKQTDQTPLAQNTLREMLRKDPQYEWNAPAPFGYFQEKINYGEYLSAFQHVMQGSSGPEFELGRLYLQYLMSGREDGRRIEISGPQSGLFGQVLALKSLIDRDAPNGEIQALVEKMPKNLTEFGSLAFSLRAEAMMRVFQYDLARADLEQALELTPRAAAPLWLRATLEKKQKFLDAADRTIEELLRYHPDYIPAIVWARKS